MDNKMITLQKNLEMFLNKKFEELTLSMKKDMDEKFGDVERKLSHQAATIDILKNIFKDFQTKNTALEKKQEILEEETLQLKNTLEEEKRQLTKRVKDLEMMMQDSAEEANQCKLEVTGVPSDINYEDFTQTLFKKANLDKISGINKYNINVIDKKKAHGSPMVSLVITFKTNGTRNAIIQHLRKERPVLTIRGVTGKGQDTPIYISECLTRKLKQILYEAKKVKMENNYKYLWVKNGQILLRKTTESNVLRISSLEEIANI